ncbi:ABC transporter ATP-binding protein [Geminicoccaceae bacterium 1502E]|nr:ABC transporter ATP-binding protein [Geminicoccaceae bacterium 1502E]
MERSIFAYIRRYSWRQQLVILGLTLLSFPPLYLTLELPKTIINEALGDSEGPWLLFGRSFSQVEYLFALCAIFLALVLVSGAIKYVLNVYAGITAERMLRRLRYELFGHVLRFPLPHFRRVSQGELVQMINAETEALGGYVGDALAVPAFQGGTLLTILTFMFMQDPILGFAAVALYPLQIYLIPRLQRKVNALGKQRVLQVRRNAEKISETVAGVRDIRANDATRYERARFSEQLGQVFWIRFDIYKKKFLIKFINNFIAQLGPFFFFSIGGYLVIAGDITLGALVAVVGAQKDLASPWKELLTYYQTMWDVRIKYDQTVSQFAPAGLHEARLQDEEPETIPALDGPIKVSGVSHADEGGGLILDNVGFEIRDPCHIAILGPAGAGKEELSLMLAGLLPPQGGRIWMSGQDVAGLPEAVLGRRIGYVGSPSAVFSGTIEDNLLYGLMYRPVRPRDIPPEIEDQHRLAVLEAIRAGNSPHDPEADWIDYEAIGISGPKERLGALVRVLRLVLLEEDVYRLGVRSTLPETLKDELTAALLEARRVMQERLAGDERLARLVEPFDPDRYNNNATMAENLLFGTPVGSTFDIDNLARHPYVRRVLRETGLLDTLLEVGLQVAETMVELFADLPPEHEYFRQFSFIAPDELPDYRALVTRADRERLGELDEADRQRLLSLPFKLIPTRHRLGLVEEPLQERILEARRWFRDHLPEDLQGAVAFFDPARYNEATTIQDNILFGKIAYGQAQAAHRVAELLTEIINEVGLHDRITEVGLMAPAGVAGGRLSAAQRQKLAIARSLLKRPDILVCYEATGALDAVEQAQVRDAMREEMKGRWMFWATSREDWGTAFDHVLVLERGRIVRDGRLASGEDGKGTPLVAAS